MKKIVYILFLSLGAYSFLQAANSMQIPKDTELDSCHSGSNRLRTRSNDSGCDIEAGHQMDTSFYEDKDSEDNPIVKSKKMPGFFFPGQLVHSMFNCKGGIDLVINVPMVSRHDTEKCAGYTKRVIVLDERLNIISDSSKIFYPKKESKPIFCLCND